ncbi:DUF748 domain-containing protein [Salinibacter sp. 10B]|uniref:DUF748 domain-containing protein n=1 Tax=Salinibacter sp. 10B TaxID=1923971 RepID=UPI0011B05C47|nr:DUF748 domain-containing protein [Salinibacter sp. 10B]
MGDSTPNHRTSRKRLLRTVGRWAALLVLLLGVGLLTAQVLLETVVDAGTVETIINDELSRSTNGRYHATVEAVDWSLWNRSAQIRGAVLKPDSAASRAQNGSREQPLAAEYAARIDTLQLTGLHLWPLLWQRMVSVETVSVRRPTLRITRHEHTRSDQDTTMPPPLQQRLPAMAIQHLEVRRGTLVTRGAASTPAPPMPVDSLWGGSLSATGVRTDPGALRDTSRLVVSDCLRISVEGYRRLSADRLFAVRMGPVRGSGADSSLAVENVQAHPTVPDAEFMRRHGHRTNRLDASIRRVALQGIDLQRALVGDALLLRTAVLDSLRVDVYRDNRLPPPRSDPPPNMPHERAQLQRRPFQIDSIRVTNGAVRYAKWDSASAAPGHITFGSIKATIRNVTNRPRDTVPASPAIIDATTRVAGTGRLATTIRLPLRSPTLSFSYEGRLGPMDPRAFNDALVPLSGVRIEDGHLDSLRFSAQVEDGEARGTLHGTYRSLDVEVVDEDKGRSLGTRLRSFVLDKLMVKSSNTPDDPPLRTGTIEHEYEEGDTFFKFLWHSLRSGLYSLVGL